MITSKSMDRRGIQSSNYNFTGDVIETKTGHQVPGNSMEVYNTYAYDKAKRLQWETSQVTGDPNPVMLQKSVYDELGRLKRKYLHGDETGALQTVDYTYNIRDWLTGINDPENVSNTQGSDYFGMSLGYTTGDNPQYNGNISEMHWKTVSFGFNGYQFDYDGANRLKEAVFNGTGQHNTSYSYDKNGNILSLTRQGQLGGGPESGMIDSLLYSYNGNQLISVQDLQYTNYQSNGFSDNGMFEEIEYLYDFNGNMIEDSNKRLMVNRYNYLNLPEQIQISMNGLNHINYLYDAAGTKLARQTVEEGIPDEEITTYYIGSFVYEDSELQYLLTSEGRVVFNPDGTHEYQYFLKDHLGNTRVTFGEDGIIQEDSYYPFGMAMAGLSQQTGEDLPNKYLYNGKELQDDYGLDWYDYGARFYDPVIGRWHVVDPAAEIARRWTPYQYAYNNPIRFIDPDGMVVDDIYNYAGKYLGSTSSGDKIRIMNVTKDEYNHRSEDYIIQKSRVVTIESSESVNNKLNNMSTQTNNGGVETKAYIVLDTENASLTLDIQPESAGDSKHDCENLYEGPIEIGSDSYNKPLGGSDYDVIVGQAHAHNADKSGSNADGSSGYTYSSTEIISGTSDNDASAAQELGVPVHAIDGNSGQLNRVLPSGEPSPNVNKNTLLRESLEIYGGKR